MDIPQPVDINKLKGILGSAKSIMQKVENKDFSTGHVNARALTEEGVQELYNEGYSTPSNNSQLNTVDPTSENYADTVKNSKLPDVIKRAMLDNPIPKIQPTLTNTFSLNDDSDMIEKPMGLPKTPKTSSRNVSTLKENVSHYNSDMITISRAELSLLIKEEVMNFLTKSYTESLTESAIKKTITTLIKEGKIVTKKKTV
jgi:hypothetical protein